MAHNVFRITPRASQTIRAIERFLQDHLDNEFENPVAALRVIFNAGDFKFEDVGAERTVVHVSNLEAAHVLAGDTEFQLSHHKYEGNIILKKHRVKVLGKKDFIHYTTEGIHLDYLQEEDEDD